MHDKIRPQNGTSWVALRHIDFVGIQQLLLIPNHNWRLHGVSLSPRHSSSRYTYDDYLLWPADERWELIHGVAYAMSPAPSPLHQRTVKRLVRQLDDYFEDRPCEAYIAPFDVRLPEKAGQDDPVHTVVQPDISVICDKTKIDEKGCLGAPDFIIEVLSPGTAAYDQIEKADLYAEYGVREYWTVHPTDRLLTIRTLRSSGGFSPPQLVAARGVVSVTLFPGLQLDLDRIFQD